MKLFEMFRSNKKLVAEGGNVSSLSPGWQGAADQEAEEIDLKIHDRDFMVGQIRELLNAQNESFKAAYGRYIWDPKLLASGQMFSGSSLHFFDVKGISTQDFLNKLKKTKVGDIDTQIDQDIGDEVTAWLKSVIGKKVGNGTFLGFNSSLSSLWLLDNPPVRVQVDYELGPYVKATGKKDYDKPSEWFAYSHSSDLADLEQNIKGVFHKYINRALTQSQTSTKYVARVLKKSVKISDKPITDSDYSFAVQSSQGGGLAAKYKPYIDPDTGQPMEIDGIPVMQELDSKDRDYVQNLDLQFQQTYGRKRTAADKKLQNSFVGTLQLMNKSFSPEQNEAVARGFLKKLFEPGEQMISKDDPVRDRDIKFAAVDSMLLGNKDYGTPPLNVPDAKSLRQEAIDMAMAYEQDYKDVEAYKKANPQSKRPRAELAKLRAAQQQVPVNEAEVKAQLRKGMPHLRDLKPADFLDLLDEIRDEHGNFKLQDIPLNVKVDGFGGRFGKNADGQPFMGTSRTEPRYKAGFLDYHQQKGTTDPDVLRRAGLFDDLFNEMMHAIKMVDQELGADFLTNKQVTCEILFAPFATETPEGKLKFVGIEYNKLPQGVELVLVPYRIVDATTGEDIPETEQALKAITNLGNQGKVMFMSNRLIQKQGLDVTAIIPPLENLKELQQIVSDTAGKRDRASLALRKQVEEKLKPVQIALEKAIDEDPNIIGKDMLGQDYEGIVINSRLGPIKVTSQRQKDIITAKNAARVAARTEQPRENTNKTAVVAIGSFVGHIGHEQLWEYTVKKAEELGGDPYLFIGNAQGKDDPIPPSVKVQTWHKMYPQYARNISTVTQEGGSLLQKIKHELINPLPGKPPRYDNIVIMVGEDQAGLTMPQALMKAVNKFPGYEHVKVSLEPTPRGTGMSFTKLRNALKNTNLTPEEQYAEWARGFDEKKLGKDWILHLMDIARKGMGITQQPAKVAPQPVAEIRLFNSLVRPSLLENKKEQGVAEGYEGDDRGDYHSTARAANQASRTAKSRQDHAKAADLHSRAATYGLSAGQDQSVIRDHQVAAHEHNRASKGLKEQGVAEGYNDISVGDYVSYDDGAGTDRWEVVSIEGNRVELRNDQGGTTFADINNVLKEQGVAEGVDNPEYNDEAGMAQSNLITAARAVKGLLDTIQDKDNLPEWAQEKIAKAEMMLVSVWDYLQSQKELGMDPKVAETMLPKSAFAGSNKNKLGPAAHLKGSMKRPARQGDLVGGGAEESIAREAKKKTLRNTNPCWKGYKPVGTKKKAGRTVPNCVPVSEDVERIMTPLVESILAKYLK